MDCCLHILKGEKSMKARRKTSRITFLLNDLPGAPASRRQPQGMSKANCNQLQPTEKQLSLPGTRA
jgi:hypothetical protein